MNEFDVCGVPVSVHICHDRCYPELWILPVMFGARLVLHPANGGLVSASVDVFEGAAKTDAGTSHVFHYDLVTDAPIVDTGSVSVEEM